MKKVGKLIASLLLLFFLFIIYSNSVFAQELPIVERLSQDTIKIRAYNIYHGFDFQDDNFLDNFPANCYDDSQGNVYWYVTYFLTNSENAGSDLFLQTPQTPGHYPTTFDYTITFPEGYDVIYGQRLIQHCSDQFENTASMNYEYNLYLRVRIARDLGVLNVDTGNTLDIYADLNDENRASPEDILWDLDNDGIFETQGRNQVFSAVGLAPGAYPIRIQISDAWDTAEDSFNIDVLDYPVNLTIPESTASPGSVTEFSGFINPENSLLEDGVGAIQDGDPEFFKIQYDITEPIFSTFAIAFGEISVRAKNTGTDPGDLSVQIFGDRAGRQADHCAQIATSEEFIEYTCSVNLYDWEDEVYKWTGFSLDFNSYDGRQENIEIDSVSLKYRIKESLLDIPLSPGGPYTVVAGEPLQVTAESSYPGAENLNYFWDLDGDGYYDHGGDFSTTLQTYDIPPGEYTLRVKALSAGGGSKLSDETTVTVLNEPTNTPTPTPTPTDPVTVTVNAASDTNVRSGQDNRNYGASEFMRIQSSGNNRALVKFDQDEIETIIGDGTILTAKVQLTITDNGNNWGSFGRPVDIHRLTSDWSEGNGTEDDRGDDNGATWNCAIDSLIENQAKNCSGITEWEMGQPNNPSVHPWIESPTDTYNISNEQGGEIEYYVTSDVQEFLDGNEDNFGWIIKKTNEGQSGMVSFGTKESSYTPQLVITYQP